MDQPKTLEEACDQLATFYKNDDFLEQFKKSPEHDLILFFQNGLGSEIHNKFELWDTTSELCKDISKKFNNIQLSSHEACFYIIKSFWSMLIHKPKIIHKGKWLTFYEKNGYEYFHRHNKPEAVAIVAITENNELVIVEQTRLPHDKTTVEIPAGLVDPGETYEITAKRELLEETGYGEGIIQEVIKDITVTPGICTERLVFVIMTDVKKIGNGGGLASENEFINISLHSLNKPFHMNSNYTSKYLDMKLLVGLYLASKYSKNTLP